MICQTEVLFWVTQHKSRKWLVLFASKSSIILGNEKIFHFLFLTTLSGSTSMLNDDGMAACGFFEIFMTRKVQGSLSEVSRESTKPMKMTAEQENNFWKDCGKRYSSIKLLKDIFEWMNLNEIWNIQSVNISIAKTYLYIFCFSAKSSDFWSPLRLLSWTLSSPLSGPPYITALRAHSTLKYARLTSLCRLLYLWCSLVIRRFQRP